MREDGVRGLVVTRPGKARSRCARREFLFGTVAALGCGCRGRGVRVQPLRASRVRHMAKWAG